MIGAPPERGSLLRYVYLSVDERAEDQEDGRPDRPMLVLVLAVRDEDGVVELLVLPVTDSPPPGATDAVAFPSAVKRRMGLDRMTSWIVTTEANAFVWPGPDIRPIPGRAPHSVAYGRVPNDLLAKVARSYLANRTRQRAHLVQRTE